MYVITTTIIIINVIIIINQQLRQTWNELELRSNGEGYTYGEGKVEELTQQATSPFSTHNGALPKKGQIYRLQTHTGWLTHWYFPMCDWTSYWRLQYRAKKQNTFRISAYCWNRSKGTQNQWKKRPLIIHLVLYGVHEFTKCILITISKIHKHFNWSCTFANSYIRFNLYFCSYYLSSDCSKTIRYTCYKPYNNTIEVTNFRTWRVLTSIAVMNLLRPVYKQVKQFISSIKEFSTIRFDMLCIQII